ncbi:MAG: hypothetical protein WD066_16595 [Planctomycetaceae bacterium]
MGLLEAGEDRRQLVGLLRRRLGADLRGGGQEAKEDRGRAQRDGGTMTALRNGQLAVRKNLGTHDRGLR